MLTYKGGNTVGTGTYWDVSGGRRIDVAGEAVLAGGGAATYIKAPVGIALLAMPVVGLAYVVLMPVLGIATIASIGGARILSGLADAIGKSFSFGWRPGNAYLAGKKKKKKDR